jgi:hypothetical protein
MKSMNVMLIVLMANFPGIALADGAASPGYVGGSPARQSGNFRYVGNNLAKQICKAVMNDDVSQLKRVLHDYQQSLSHRYMFDLAGRELSRDFTCNDMDVDEFSRRVGASKVASFISGTGQTPDTHVAVTGS